MKSIAAKIIIVCLGILMCIFIGYKALYYISSEILFNDFFRPKFVSDTSAPIQYPSPNQDYKRDSLFISLTVLQYSLANFYPFHQYRNSTLFPKNSNFMIDTILYSPDRLKFVAFLIEHWPVHSDQNRIDCVYTGTTLFGFRSRINEIWKIYAYGALPALETYNDNRLFFHNYYLGNGKFKTDGEYYWDSTTSKLIPIDNGYNIDDPRFWNKSIVWKIGSRVPGYYAFQTKGNVSPESDDPIVILPKLQYPDSLLQLFKQQ